MTPTVQTRVVPTCSPLLRNPQQQHAESDVQRAFLTSRLAMAALLPPPPPAAPPPPFVSPPPSLTTVVVTSQQVRGSRVLCRLLQTWS